MNEIKKDKRQCKQKIISWDEVDSYLQSGCKGTEVADILGIHPDTLYKRCQDEIGTTFSAYSQQKRAKGCAILQVAQFDLAIKGNATMLIWLGKQRLGQHEPEPETPTKNLAAVQELFNYISNGKISEAATEKESLNK